MESNEVFKMMTKDEALKMAIEAFDNIDMSNQTNEECARAWFIEGYVQALEWPPKEALEQPSVAELNDEYLHDTYVEGLSQPAQEPVALKFPTMLRKMWSGGEVQEWLDKQQSLYTQPATSWQGLSDDEIWNIANFLGKNKEWDYPVMFAKTIEKSIKEKNT
jgi:hypothetical protein